MLVPSPSPSDLITDAEDLAVVAARCAPQSEAERRLSGDVVEGLRAGGFAAHFVPAAHGGKEGTFTELSEAVARVGQSCAATAWCASLVANLGRMAGLLPAAGQAEVWAAGPGAVVVGSLAPTGTAERVTGGWQISGAWPYISAVDFSDWALLCARVPADGPEAARMFAAPRSAYQIADTWSKVGMSGTGSNILEATLVPHARSFERQNLFTGTPAASTARHVVDRYHRRPATPRRTPPQRRPRPHCRVRRPTASARPRRPTAAPTAEATQTCG